MYEYMKALYLRFFREPDCAELRQEIREARQELRTRLGREDKRTLLRLTDGLSCCGEETALESFTAVVPAGLGYGPGTEGAGDSTPLTKRNRSVSTGNPCSGRRRNRIKNTHGIRHESGAVTAKGRPRL